MSSKIAPLFQIPAKSTCWEKGTSRICLSTESLTQNAPRAAPLARKGIEIRDDGSVAKAEAR
jgi:hypothetical protein